MTGASPPPDGDPAGPPTPPGIPTQPGIPAQPAALGDRAHPPNAAPTPVPGSAGLSKAPASDPAPGAARAPAETMSDAGQGRWVVPDPVVGSGPLAGQVAGPGPAAGPAGGPAGGALRLRGVGMDFHGGRRRRRGGVALAPSVPTLADVDLAVAPGEFVCIVGASGSGKSTLLRLAAGLLRPTTGEVTLDGVPVDGPSQERGLVCQTGALFPWRSAAANIAFGLELLPMSRLERHNRVGWYLREIGLEALASRLPGQLSGGQRQRVAIARALVCEPRVVLLDEPFGALDVQTKEDMQLFLRRVWADTGTTVLMVTHDVEEAVFLGQRVVVLASDPGRVVADIPVRLPGDRDLATRRDPAFLALRSEVEDLVRVHHRAHTRLAEPAG